MVRLINVLSFSVVIISNYYLPVEYHISSTADELEAAKEKSEDEWNISPGTNEEWSDLDRKLLREELEAEEW